MRRGSRRSRFPATKRRGHAAETFLVATGKKLLGLEGLFPRLLFLLHQIRGGTSEGHRADRFQPPLAGSRARGVFGKICSPT